MNLKNLVLVTLLSLAAVWARPKTDVIVMRNGDHLTCEIKKLERGVLYAGFDYIDGTISVDWAKVAHVESTQLFVVSTQAGNVYEGTLRTATTAAEQPVRIEILEETGTPEVVEQRQVVEMAQTATSFRARDQRKRGCRADLHKGQQHGTVQPGVRLQIRPSDGERRLTSAQRYREAPEPPPRHTIN